MKRITGNVYLHVLCVCVCGVHMVVCMWYIVCMCGYVFECVCICGYELVCV